MGKVDTLIELHDSLGLEGTFGNIGKIIEWGRKFGYKVKSLGTYDTDVYEQICDKLYENGLEVKRLKKNGQTKKIKEGAVYITKVKNKKTKEIKYYYREHTKKSSKKGQDLVLEQSKYWNTVKEYSDTKDEKLKNEGKKMYEGLLKKYGKDKLGFIDRWVSTGDKKYKTVHNDWSK